MSLRPAVAALACSSCRRAVLGAVLGLTATGVGGLGAGRPQPLAGLAPAFPSWQRRFNSSLGAERRPDSDADSPPTDEAVEQGQDGLNKHWFLDVEPPRHPPSPHIPALPSPPTRLRSSSP